MIIAGSSLIQVDSDDNLRELFLSISDKVDVVLACRVSPKQKADIVRMMGRSLENGHLDTNSALHNLSAALTKLEKAGEFLRK